VSFLDTGTKSSLQVPAILTSLTRHFCVNNNKQLFFPFQTQNVPISQILPSIDISHLFRLISQIPGLHYVFSLFQFFF